MPATPLINGLQAYPAMERLVLEAETSVWMAFRIFDPTTKLRSTEAADLGLKTWHDLVAHALARGIVFRIRLTDFDPGGGPHLHRHCWQAVRAMEDLREAYGDALQVFPAMHPHTIGSLPNAVFWPAVRQRLARALLETVDGEDAPEFKAMRVHGSVRLWPPHAIRPATHHEKVIVTDGNRAVLGGLDINDRRYDTHVHKKPTNQTWHDVSLLIEGADSQAAIADLQRHLAEVWNSSAIAEGSPRPPLQAPELGPAREHQTVHFCSTQSGTRDGLVQIAPKPVSRSIEEETLALIGSARSLIYIETQFLRSAVIANALADALRQHPNLNLITLLPASPEDVAYEGNTGPDARHGEWLQARCIGLILSIAGPRALFVSPVGAKPPTEDSENADARRQTVQGRWPIYVHAKVMIADGNRALVSSANLNGRSMRWDSEAGVVWDAQEDVRAFQAQLLAKHLRPEEPLDENMTAIDIMHAVRSAASRGDDAPLAIYPHTRARRFAAPRFYIPDDMI